VGGKGVIDVCSDVKKGGAYKGDGDEAGRGEREEGGGGGGQGVIGDVGKGVRQGGGGGQGEGKRVRLG